jgi:hypothetical protein
VRGEYGVYEVTGRRQYRGHDPGAVFTARLNPNAEMRAVNRGDIRLLERREPTLEPQRLRIAKGWLG